MITYRDRKWSSVARWLTVSMTLVTRKMNGMHTRRRMSSALVRTSR
jgi:hypothetical protein